MRPKICIIDAGGSLGMQYNLREHTLERADIIAHLFRHIPELQSKFQIDIVPLFQGHSYNLTTEHWIELCETIHQHYEDYDGFVVLHGTSTMAYTASFLSFAFQQLDKPIVFTGSILPLEELGSEARSNIIHSCMVASMDIAEVVIVYGTSILRANRTTKVEESYHSVFGSPNLPPLGSIKRPIHLSDHRKKRRKRKLLYKPECNPNVLVLRLTPGMDADSLFSLATTSKKAIILEAYGAGVFPNTYLSVLKKLIQNTIPVVLASQMHQPIATPFTYNYDADLHESSLIFGFDMTIEALVAKLMWVMHDTQIPLLIKKKMETNLAEEVSQTLLDIAPQRKF